MPGLVERATSDDRLMMVSRQLDAMQEDPKINTIGCPYCGSMNQDGDTFCCTTLIRAITALLDARDALKQVRGKLT